MSDRLVPDALRACRPVAELCRCGRAYQADCQQLGCQLAAMRATETLATVVLAYGDLCTLTSPQPGNPDGH
jgi:hypothetical protein